ncbi:hypothetical protein F751_1546 [Auxenochlorella protothecoides]|uniref:Uncharacterized protein n=1 Tax=Auxenochlorella protothecoides TaxID=3075 RepID=A0A087SRB3_AUXPR|nr:hypothetical protein F751_1546 [Auxenochlorella protothecoides]KFM28267.1 hypothetical protein F751_1546 [Auxenochlorella protothecoides]
MTHPFVVGLPEGVADLVHGLLAEKGPNQDETCGTGVEGGSISIPAWKLFKNIPAPCFGAYSSPT